MEPKIQSSFIPKNPVSLENKPRHTKSSVSLLFVASLSVLLVVAVLWGGLFFYKIFLDNEIENKANMLESARVQFAPALIQEIERFGHRIDTTETLLGRHLAPSILFSIISERTLKTVQFNELMYKALPDGGVTVSMAGVAHSFSSVALQSDSFEKEKALIDPVFSNLNLDESGNVIFNFTAEVDPSLLSYGNLVEELAPPEDLAEVPITTEIATTTTGTTASTPGGNEGSLENNSVTP